MWGIYPHGTHDWGDWERWERWLSCYHYLVTWHRSHVWNPHVQRGAPITTSSLTVCERKRWCVTSYGDVSTTSTTSSWNYIHYSYNSNTETDRALRRGWPSLWEEISHTFLRGWNSTTDNESYRLCGVGWRMRGTLTFWSLVRRHLSTLLWSGWSTSTGPLTEE